jgi:phage shock protein PspC (stress-responsive transcriptional regulator)
MNETQNDPGTQTGPLPPQPPGPHQDLDRLRRSTSNRYVAGVAGGLGRHFDIDPTIIRVLLVVLTFFGGAGILIYAVCWLLVPEDTAEHATVRVGTEPRKILLLVAAGIAFLLAAGDLFNGFDYGFDSGWFLVSAGVIVATVLIVRDRAGERRTQSPQAPPATPSSAPSSAPPSAPSSPSTAAPGAAEAPTGVPAYATTWSAEPTQSLADQPPAWQPPVAQPPLLQPHPKRTGIIWFWPTLALIAVGLGVLGIYDNHHHVVDGAYPALALAITAVMLLVGSVVGRPGGLILLGFLSSIALAGSVAVGGSYGVDAKQIHEHPLTAAAVQDRYEATVGEIKLDLSDVADPQALAGREIDLQLRTGYIEVIVPRGLNVHVDALMDVAGGITVPGNDGGGFHHDVDTTLVGTPTTTTAPLELDIDAKFGQITVEYE